MPPDRTNEFSSQPPEQHRLLVVDDEFHNRLALSRRLARGGYAVDTAEGGAEALDKILRDHYDLVLLDQMMPGMSGVDLLKLLRATYSPVDLPVIMVTGIDEKETMVEALEEGANDYVVKPVEIPEITARIETQLARARSGRRTSDAEAHAHAIRAAATPAGAAVWEWDPKTGVTQYSSEWAQIVGCASNEISQGLNEWLDRIHPQDLVRVRKELKAHLDGRAEVFRSEHRLRRKDCSYRWVASRALAMRDPAGRLLRLTGAMEDIEERKALDPLTGLGNRLQLLDRLTEALHQDPPILWGVLLFDLDDFRMLNEEAGHEVADQVLMEVAARLRDALQRSVLEGPAVLARMSGDEFAVVATCPRGAQDVEQLALELMNCLRDPIAADDRALEVSACVGAALSAGGATPDQMLRDADMALRAARQAGRGSWKLYEPDLRGSGHARATMHRDLRFAVDRNQLVAFYQSKVNLRTGAIAGFEALLRWQHPELGMIAPGQFIPLAEETGLILPAGEWILRQACRQMKAWQQQFVGDGGEPLAISVNLSARQLSDPNLLRMVRRVLAETNLAPGSLALELTESSLIEEAEAARGVLTDLQRLGVGLMLDDFGTGYASLRYLNVLHFDVLKIDRPSFQTWKRTRAVARLSAPS
ncbi:MAG: EAL domain-containing protein [Acidobacteriota bacterium]